MPRAKISDAYGLTVEVEANEISADDLIAKTSAAFEKAVAIVDRRPIRRGGREIGFSPIEAEGDMP